MSKEKKTKSVKIMIAFKAMPNILINVGSRSQDQMKLFVIVSVYIFKFSLILIPTVTLRHLRVSREFLALTKHSQGIAFNKTFQKSRQIIMFFFDQTFFKKQKL